jgi:hypothetical protein
VPRTYSMPRIVAPRATPPPLPPAARSGELGSRTKPTTTQPPQSAVPTMIVQGEGSSRVEIAVPPLPAGVRDLSQSVTEDSWMVNPDTNLLRAHRWKGIVTTVLVIGALAAIAIAVVLITSSGRDDGDTATGSNEPGVTPKSQRQQDAAVVEPPGIDAGSGMSKEDIYAISRFGYFTIKANAKTTIYVDGKYIGETPMTRLPLPPGPKKIKAVGPKNKTKQFTTTILGGQDTDEGTIIW